VQAEKRLREGMAQLGHATDSQEIGESESSVLENDPMDEVDE